MPHPERPDSYNPEPLGPAAYEAADYDVLPIPEAGAAAYDLAPISRMQRANRWITPAVLAATVVTSPIVRGEIADGLEAAGVYETVTAQEVSPGTQEVLINVLRDFTEAVAVDTCETRVTVRDLATMHQRLWMVEEQPDMTPKELEARAGQLIQKVEESRERLGIGHLPENFAELRDDATGEHVIPVETYQETAKKYFDSVGIDAVFDWDAETADELLITNVDAKMTPLTPEAALGDNPVVRKRIVEAMADIATAPPSTYTEPRIEYIFFGDHQEQALGEYLPESIYRHNALLIDTATEADPAVASYINEIIVSHEVAHNYMESVCGVEIPQDEETDPAMDQLNGFIYSPEQADKLRNGELIDGRYGTLISVRFGDVAGPADAGEVPSVRPYGVMTHYEGTATEIGEMGFSTEYTPDLYSDGRDLTKLQEKLTLQLARLAAKHPEDAEYVVQLLELARLQTEAIRLAVGARAEHEDYAVEHPETIMSVPDTEARRLSGIHRAYQDVAEAIDAARDPARHLKRDTEPVDSLNGPAI